jgi:hypothetical protein
MLLPAQPVEAIVDSNRPRKLSFFEGLAIKDGVGGGLLPCGCAYGRYVTYRDASLTVIDDVSRQCPEHHERHMVIPPPPPPAELAFLSP